MISKQFPQKVKKVNNPALHPEPYSVSTKDILIALIRDIGELAKVAQQNADPYEVLVRIAALATLEVRALHSKRNEQKEQGTEPCPKEAPMVVCPYDDGSDAMCMECEHGSPHTKMPSCADHECK